MSTLSDLWKGYVAKNPGAVNNPVPFQTPMKAPVIANAVTVPPPNKPIFNTPPVEQKVEMPKEYINPATGQLWTPEEYANNVAAKIPVKTPKGDVPTYAGNQFTQAPQTAEQLQVTTAGLNNARNDIATGTTDPYNAGAKSGIAYSPAELKAIESAYAGLYDPAINSALAKLDAKQKEDAALIASKQRMDEQIFATNENIRQWKATTGLKGGSGSDVFTQTQLNSGASNAGMAMETFNSLDDDIKNFYINPPMGKNFEDKNVPKYELFNELMKDVADGKITPEQAADEISGSTTLPNSVKHYFLAQIPLAPAVKDGYFAKIWKAVTGQ